MRVLWSVRLCIRAVNITHRKLRASSASHDASKGKCQSANSKSKTINFGLKSTKFYPKAHKACHVHLNEALSAETKVPQPWRHPHRRIASSTPCRPKHLHHDAPQLSRAEQADERKLQKKSPGPNLNPEPPEKRLLYLIPSSCH